ncbi:MAG TPA: hypothetical protein VMC09_01485 [Anaerolineales bacterium]|nr:hypothetical protein [Anaerolineales bacterium]
MSRFQRTLPAYILLLIAAGLILSGCTPSPEQQATGTATSETATAAVWTKTATATITDTSTFTLTFTSTYTPTETFTPTITFTPTKTATNTKTFTPTFDFPKVTVNVNMAACLYGPAKAYLWQYDLALGDTGVVWGRAANSNWLYVKMDRWPGPCWLSPAVVTVDGNVNRLLVQPVRLPITNALYHAPTGVKAERNGNTVSISWDQVAMTVDDDRGYFLDVWVCQKGHLVWVPTALPDQYHLSAAFTDERGCGQPSWAKLYTVEKHGYTSPVDVPWPPFPPTPTPLPTLTPSDTFTPSDTPVPSDTPIPPTATT